MSLRRFPDVRDYAPQMLLVAGVAFGSWACGGSSSPSPSPAAEAAPTSAAPTVASSDVDSVASSVASSVVDSVADSAAVATIAPASPDTLEPRPPLVIEADGFVALADMTPVRGFFVDNLLGDIDATVAVAESPTGGAYPLGSVVQLIPGEVMVKREAGFSPSTKDWEFFELDVDATGSTIRVRGGDEVVNRFGGSCASCHELAAPEWDLICEQDHGCEPLPFDRATIEAIQSSDPRPRR